MERKLKSMTESESTSEVEGIKSLSEERMPAIEENIDNRVMEALGKNPTSSKKEGDEVHEEMAVRWKNYLVEGIHKEVREQLVQKYPKNCTNLKPSTLNPEIEDFVLSQIQS
ncbi:unnamed protein product [Psylliodes chrysocephalus]|uniref:Uncharacterized protein n=1 Tax=Psylliodes chrysocephalus TaxID=3402493 RepID=A0A9P0DB09_9CUCU|nr:unnamed protein product [Psylliodes chrysocephala]